MAQGMDTKNFWQVARDLAILVGVGVAAIIILNYSTDIFQTPRIIEREVPAPTPTSTPPVVTVEPKPSEYPDFDQLSNLKKISIATEYETWTPEAVMAKAKVNNTVVVQRGSIAKAYVYIRASLNDRALTQWESVYLKLNNLGGHLFRPQSLPVPPSNKTQLLFALNDVPYLDAVPYSEQKTPARVNIFPLFKEKAEITIISFISSLRPAKLEELTIYYECIDGNESCELVIK